MFWLPDKYFSKIELDRIEEFLKKGFDVIVDSINLRQEKIDSLNKLADKYNAETEFVRLCIPYREAVERDRHRKRSVGERIIRKIYMDYFRDEFIKEIKLREQQ